MAYLEITNACVHFPVRNTWGTTGEVVRAVDGVSLSVEKGRILGLVGESGCGKSTLTRAIMQLQPLTAGCITLNGENLTAHKVIKVSVNLMHLTAIPLTYFIIAQQIKVFVSTINKAYIVFSLA